MVSLNFFLDYIPGANSIKSTDTRIHIINKTMLIEMIYKPEDKGKVLNTAASLRDRTGLIVLTPDVDNNRIAIVLHVPLE